MIFLGKTLTKDDLPIFIYSNGQLVDPCSITYTIFDCTTGKSEIIRQTINSKPMKFDKGCYFIPLRLNSQIFRTGRHIVQWQVKQYSDSDVQQVIKDFDIIRPAHFAGEFSNAKYPNSTRAL